MESASAIIDGRIRELGDWRGKMLARVRAIVHEADPEIVEEWKWLDGDETPGQSAYDGLSADEVGGVVETVQGKAGILEPEQEFGAEGGAGYGGGDDGPADRRVERVSEAAAQGQVKAKGDQVGKSFENDVGVEGVRAQVDVVGERQKGAMG